jgi:hypothetical protein
METIGSTISNERHAEVMAIFRKAAQGWRERVKATISTPTLFQPRILGRVESESKPGTYQIVSSDKKGQVKCSCPGFRYRGHCRHIDIVLGKGV